MFDFIRRNKSAVIIVLIFIGALLARLAILGQLPANLHEDEVLSGYVGRFIFQNGVDVYGNKWPLLYFNKFGDYYIILPFYLSGIGTWLFGVNAFGVRFFGAVLGALSVFPVYLLGKKIFNSTKVALFSAFVIAIMPWHVNLSRTTAEGLMGTTIYSFGLVGLLQYAKTRRNFLLLISGMLFAITYLFYHPFRLYTPIIVIAFTLLNFDRKTLKNNILPVLMCVFFIVMTAYIGSTKWGSGRFTQTSIFSQLSGVSIKIQERIFNEPDIYQARIFNNKVIGYGREFLYQYSRYFSPDVLFIRGGNSPRVAIPDQGLLYITFLPLIMLCFYFLSRKNYVGLRRNNVMFLFFLLLLAPIPAGLTIIDSPNIHRAVFMTVPLSIIIGYGLYSVFTLKHYSKVVLSFVVLAIGIEVAIFQHNYVVQSDLYSSVARNDGQREVVDYAVRNKHLYDKIYLPVEGNFPLYFLFYTKNFDRSLSQKIKSDIKMKNIGNVYFVKLMCDSKFWKKKPQESIIVIRLDDCGKMKFYKKIGKIHGINKLHTYKIYSSR